ncbi:unnamed protein product [Parajaminaea phylloscopi]
MIRRRLHAHACLLAFLHIPPPDMAEHAPDELAWPTLWNGAVDVMGLDPAHVKRLAIGSSVSTGTQSSSFTLPELKNPTLCGIDLITNSRSGVTSYMVKYLKRCHVIPRGPSELNYTVARMQIILYSTGLFRAASSDLSTHLPCPLEDNCVPASQVILRAVTRWTAKYVLRRPLNLVVMWSAFHEMYDEGDIFILPAAAPVRALIAHYLSCLRTIQERGEETALWSWKPPFDLDTISTVEPHTTTGQIFEADPLLFRRVEVFLLGPYDGRATLARLRDPADLSQGEDAVAPGSYHVGQRELMPTTSILFLALRVALAPHPAEHPSWTLQEDDARRVERELWADLTSGCGLLVELLTAASLPDMASLSALLTRAQEHVWPPMQAAGQRDARSRSSTGSNSSASDPAEVVPQRYEAFRKWVVLDSIAEAARQDEEYPPAALASLVEQVSRAQDEAWAFLGPDVRTPAGHLVWQKVPVDFWRAVFPAPVHSQSDDDDDQ